MSLRTLVHVLYHAYFKIESDTGLDTRPHSTNFFPHRLQIYSASSLYFIYLWQISILPLFYIFMTNIHHHIQHHSFILYIYGQYSASSLYSIHLWSRRYMAEILPIRRKTPPH